MYATRLPARRLAGHQVAWGRGIVGIPGSMPVQVRYTSHHPSLLSMRRTMIEAPTTTRTANVWAWRRFLPRPAMVAAVVVVLLAASFVTQLDLMEYVGEIPVGIFIRLPILGFFAGAVLAFGPDWPMPPFAWPEGVRQPALTAAGVAAAVAAIVCALVSSK